MRKGQEEETMYQTKRYEKEITVKDYLAQYVNVEEFLVVPFL